MAVTLVDPIMADCRQKGTTWVERVQSPPGFRWTVRQVLDATAGILLVGSDDVVFRQVCTDSRRLEPGDLFVALVGEKFDGHDFIDVAVSRGAAGVLVNRPLQIDPAIVVIQVEDTLTGLGDLAARRRLDAPGLSVIAITGSAGKTTVKEMAAAIISIGHSVLKTSGNLNNLIGLPLTLFRLESGNEFAVLEMGMNRPGEIARLTEIARPDVACITNIGEAHLEGLGSIEGVAQAKGELFKGASPSCWLVVNADDPRVVELADRCSQEKVTFGFSESAQVWASDVVFGGENGTSFVLHIGKERRAMRIASCGDHNVRNALAAAAIGVCAGIAVDDIVRGLTAWEPYSQRFQIKTTPEGIKVVDDTYNANPSSMRAALETVGQMAPGKRTVAILGDMLELGDHSPVAHREVGKTAAATGFSYLFAMGRQAEQVVSGARSEGMAETQIGALTDHGEAVARIRALSKQNELGIGDWILVKGSRGMRMEVVVQGLCEPEKASVNR